MMVGALLAIAGSIYLVLAGLHMFYTFLDSRKPRYLAPDDPALVTAMQTARIRVTGGEMTMWQGWITFNYTHSIGGLLFGGLCIVLALSLGRFAVSPWALLALAGVSGLYLWQALRYWFRVPRTGVLLATLCLLAAWAVYAL
jgi:hypothetical protein